MTRLRTSVALAVAVAMLAGCSAAQPQEAPDAAGAPGALDAGPDGGLTIPREQLPSLAAQLQSSGRTVYYLGATAHGLALNSFADGLNGTGFMAGYGTCDPGESGCAEPVGVFTAPWEAEPAGFDCRRLTPQLSVPTLLVWGEVTLYTGRQVVRILDVLDGDPPPGDRADHALALVPQLRPVGADQAAESLPPPDPEVTKWLESTCPQAAASGG